MKTGQNDLCPCGSGIKFKVCCANKLNGGAHRPKLNAVMAEVRELLEGRSFASLEEANAFLSQHTQQRNQAPKDDFDGLSLEQMHRFLHFPFETPDLVSFPSCLDVSPEAPVLTLFRLLTEVLGDKGIKATSTGNLTRKLCRDIAMAFWGEEKYRETYRFGDLRSEPEFFDLHVTRLVSGLSGFVRKYNGKFIISGECRKLMSKLGLAGIYPRLFREFTTRYNWAFRDRWQQIPLIQQSFLFSLYLLTKHETEWQSSRFFENWFLRAFPALLQEVSPIGDYYSPEKILRSCYSLRCLESFAAFLGLVEIQADSAKRYDGDFRLRKLPLLDHVVQFHL
ncbi:MAG: SEC-C domain-containing protein [Syntrophobacteraceae bacterium]